MGNRIAQGSSTPSGTKPRQCVNGCDAPVHSPSKVLCEVCFLKLDAKFRAIARIGDGGGRRNADDCAKAGEPGAHSG